MRHSIVRALGGFTTETSKTRILYCGESFDYPELEEHPYLCNHLGEFCHSFNLLIMLVRYDINTCVLTHVTRKE